jgi:arylsulfatase A-like enzyme
MLSVLFICSDTFRWDYLGCYGNDWIHTPNLDALAREGVVFLDAFSEGLPTIPARRVMHTGRRIIPMRTVPQPSDMVQLPGWHPLYAEDVTLAEVLRDAGYVTSYVTDVYHVMKPGKNFHRGFEHWDWVRGVEDDPYHLRDVRQVEEMVAQATHWGNRPADKRHWIVQHLMGRKDWKSDADTLVGRVMTRAADWLRRYTLDEPFFLYVDCFDPHEPWDPPEHHARRYSPGYEGFWYCFPPGTSASMTPEQLENVRAAYAGEVTMVDEWIGHLLGALNDAGFMDETLIVFTSDHGTMMGEQGEIHKGPDRLRNQCTQVPLIIRHTEPEHVGQQVAGFVQHQDIMPTILGRLGIRGPDRMQGEDLWPLTASGERSRRERVIQSFGQYACVRTAKWNYVGPWAPMPAGAPVREDLYDLEADPQELTNVIGDHLGVAGEFAEALREYTRAHGAETAGDLGPTGQSLALEDQARL